MIIDCIKDPVKGIEKYSWGYEELVPALKKSNIYEIGHLVETLHKDEIVMPQSGNRLLLTDYNLRNARQAYHGKKYQVKTNFWTYPLNISSVLSGISA